MCKPKVWKVKDIISKSGGTITIFKEINNREGN